MNALRNYLPLPSTLDVTAERFRLTAYQSVQSKQ